MYKNGKMRPGEGILRMGWVEVKENDGEGEFNNDILYELL
jgi:hypothetical protein